MAKTISKAMGLVSAKAAVAGAPILDVVTSGMYSNPLMVVREYVQNAVDSIDDAVAAGRIRREEGALHIEVDGLDRILTVTDNGLGVPRAEVERLLCSLGVSSKPNGGKRGFRGIGRLGGIGYCDKLVFETRYAGESAVSVVTWDCCQLRSSIATRQQRRDVGDVIHSSVRLSHRDATRDESRHFFRVAMHHVHRFHKDELMNVGVLGNYLSQVAPVPFDEAVFPLGVQIDAHLAMVEGYRSYHAYVNGVELRRPHRLNIEFGSRRGDTIQGVELFDIKGRDGRRIGRGWYAKTHYLASIPGAVAMRGIRVRQGNIEIGNEYHLEEVFTERRFATWHVGEVHLDYSLRANARRDGFEQSVDYEAFLEQATVLGRHLSQLCRVSSKSRSSRMNAERMLVHAERLVGQAFAVDEDHLQKTRIELTGLVSKLRAVNGAVGAIPGFDERLAAVSAALDRLDTSIPSLPEILDGRSLRHMDAKTVLSEVARSIIAHYDQQAAAEELLRVVLGPYLKARFTQ